MSVDEMIFLIGYPRQILTNKEAGEISAALRRLQRLEKTGQAMRDNYYSSTIGPGGNVYMDEAAHAWDEATKEGCNE